LICADYELRVTARCLREDLAESETVDLEDAQRHEIVRAFCNQRSGSPIGTRTVGPAAGARTLYRLGHRDEHRGATWFDLEESVVWLCATGKHRSGEPDDAFRYFDELIEQGLIYPEVDDYERLYDDRADRFVAFAPEELQALLAVAEQQACSEVRAVVGGLEELGIVIVVVEPMDELFVACSEAALTDPTRVVIILTALCPDRAWEEWRTEQSLPIRPLNAGEICFSIMRDGETH
jgi:hypothetical protein